MAEPVPMWWETRREPVALALEIPIGPDSDSPKPAKVRRSCMLVFGAVILRLLGLVVAVATLAMAAWCFFKIPDNLNFNAIVKLAAQGIFYIFLGGLTLLAELRTRWTMRGCLSTYILFANYLARGLLYLALGAIVFGLDFHNPPIVQKWWVAAFMLVTGGLNVLYYPFYWKYKRTLDVSMIHSVPLEPYPEEIIYGMDTLYIKNHTKVPIAPLPSPLYAEGANEVPSPNTITMEKQKAKELELITPGEPISIVVEPAPTSTTTTRPMSCSGEIRENRTNELATTAPIGIGAS